MQTAISLALGPISAAVPGSLYQQIVDAVKREIGAGRLAPSSALPSFRVLAEELVVSVITVKRAYEELEREGIIYRRHHLAQFRRLMMAGWRPFLGRGQSTAPIAPFPLAPPAPKQGRSCGSFCNSPYARSPARSG